MHYRNSLRGAVALLLSLALFTVGAQAADDPAPSARAADEQAIHSAAQQYIAALDRGDAAALAAFWTDDGDFIDALGETRLARDLVAGAAPTPGEERPLIKLLDSHIRFLTDDVAIEDGVSEVTRGGAGSRPERGRFSAIWVKSDAAWKLASLREAAIVPPARPPRLADLSWMIGEWTATNGETQLEVAARWNATETFLLRDLKVTRGGKVIFNATQRIGWDPLSHGLKSWIFDSDGGYSEGTWTRDGEAWVSESHAVLPDGRQTVSTHVLSYDGKDRFIWRSSSTQPGGENGPGVELEFTRKTAG